MKKKFYLITCLICLVVIFSKYCYGQDSKESNKGYAWVNLGFGVSSYGISAGLSGSYQKNNKIISIRHTTNIQEEFHLGGSYKDEPLLKVGDYGLLFGFTKKGKISLITISIGISGVSYNERGKLLSSNSVGGIFGYSYDIYKEINKFSIGIPFESQLFISFNNIGIGIYGYANLNIQRPFIGVLFCLQFGKIN